MIILTMTTITRMKLIIIIIIIIIIIKTIKIHKRDWLPQAPIWELRGQCTRHAC